jgi:hypothetical protein
MGCVLIRQVSAVEGPDALSLQAGSIHAAAPTAAEQYDECEQRNQEQQRINSNTACKGDHEQ